MTMTFEALSQELNLTEAYEQESQVNALADWCYKNISQDVIYDGAHKSRYNKYVKFAANYLDNFLAHLSKGFDQKITAYANLNAIQYAAQNGYDRFITKQKAVPESALSEGDDFGMTPLHKSAIQGYAVTVHALLEKGASAERINKQKQYPIQSALFVPISHNGKLIHCKEKIFRALRAKTPGVIGQQDTSGNTVMHQMALGHFDSLMAELLRSNPELALIKNNMSYYPIHTAILNHQMGPMDLLLTIKGVADLRDSKSQTPLHYAARFGTAEMVQKCCSVTQNINVCDGENKTPLLWAASAGNQAALEVLMQKGADATLTDYEGLSILHHAIKAQNKTMVRWIVENGPHDLLNQLDAGGHSPLFHAQHLNDDFTTALLLSHGAVDALTLRQ